MITSGLQSVSLDYAIVNASGVIAASFFDRSSILLRSIGASLSMGSVKIGNRHYAGGQKKYQVFYAPVTVGKEKFYYAFAIRENVNEEYFLSTEEEAAENFYHFLMHNYELPLLKEWSRALYQEALKQKLIYCSDTNCHIGSCSSTKRINGQEIERIKAYTVNMTGQALNDLVGLLFQKKQIWISEKPQKKLQFKSMDEYFQNYGHTLVENLERQITPLRELSGNLDSIVFNNMRLYPQQIAQVNGVSEMLLNGHSKYAVLNMGMGTGKTISSIAITENIFVSKYLKEHREETVKNAYSNPEAINYRAIVMCPGHLVEKWKTEILREVPYASVEILSGLSQLVALKESGKERNGKKWYIVGKDVAKLSYQSIPTPIKTGKKRIALRKCANPECGCVTNDTKGLAFVCEECGGNAYVLDKGSAVQEGMLCPSCGEVLLPNGRYVENDEGMTSALSPFDFANPTGKNVRCHCCGAELWKPHVKNINTPGTDFYEHAKKNSGWHRSTHYANKTHKTAKTVWLHKDFEEEYYQKIGEKPLCEKSEDEKGVRRYALADYIKKQLKGCFDMFIVDEAHLFKGGATAQGNAMHALAKASKYQLALTGTIAGGVATDLFYLFYRLDPVRMRSLGFEFTDEMKFAKKYGTIETVYDYVDSGETNRNQASRGRQIKPPQIKPGISPVIFRDLLLDKTVFLDLSDMSKFLPNLKEKVVRVRVDRNIEDEKGNLVPNPEHGMLSHYRNVIEHLKCESRQGEGKGILGKMLQFSLSYPDHPYGVSPIKSPFTGSVLKYVEDFSEIISNDKLLAKEKELLSIVTSELGEGRNCVVYVEYAKDPETCVSYRLKEILQKHCSLSDHEVVIIESSYPSAAKRESWMHKKAKEGAKVFIVQPKCVETGLDFCWRDKEGNIYNYPTLIFYQIGYSLFTFWQASKRAHRLNQREECRNYYMAYEGTMQEAVIQIIAEKQAATSAIQGKFSTEGLAAIAQGVDVKVRLAQAMADMDNISGSGIQEMFDVLHSENETNDDIYSDYRPMLTFKELVGDIADLAKPDMGNDDSVYDMFNFDQFTKIFGQMQEGGAESSNGEESKEEFKPDTTEGQCAIVYLTSKTAQRKMAVGQMNIFDL